MLINATTKFLSNKLIKIDILEGSENSLYGKKLVGRIVKIAFKIKLQRSDGIVSLEGPIIFIKLNSILEIKNKSITYIVIYDRYKHSDFSWLLPFNKTVYIQPVMEPDNLNEIEWSKIVGIGLAKVYRSFSAKLASS